MIKEKLPEGWEVVKLGDVAEFINGRAFKPSEWDNKGLPIIRIQNLTESSSVINYYNGVYDKKYYVDTGDILLSWSATLDIFKWKKGPALLNQHIFKVKPKGEILSDDYFLYYVKTILQKLKDKTHGSGMKHITKPELLKQEFILPPLPTQKKIVAVLEKVENLRVWRREADTLIDEFLKSTFLEMFGDPKKNEKMWPIVKIDDVVEVSQYGTSIKSNTKRNGFPLIGMANITYDGGLDLSQYSYVDLSKNEFEKLKLNEGDIIFNRTNSTELVGKTTYWNRHMDAVLASYLVKLKLKKTMHPIFFSFLMNSSPFKKLFMLRCKKAVNQANISPTLLKQFNMFLPTIELQTRFAEIVEQVEQLRESQKQSRQHIDNLFNALMQKAFGGELAC